MAKQASIVCMNCGKEIKEAAKFCPYCSAELPGGEEEQEENGYWNFYGMAPKQEEQESPPNPRGWLRFGAVVALIAGAAAGFAFNGWSWGFRWDRALLIWGCGAGLAVILFALSFAFKKPK